MSPLRGTISADTSNALITGNNSLVPVEEGGLVEATQNGPERDAIRVRNFSTVIINGRVNAPNGNNGVGRDVGNQVTVTIGSTGRIDAGDDGINLNNGAVVTNNGTISSGDEGIEVNNGGMITNSGDINADEHGIDGDDRIKIVNHGNIIGGLAEDGDDGIDVDDYADITNTGDIEGEGEGEGISGDDNGTLVNDGTVVVKTGRGVDFDTNAMVTNNGLIRS